MPGPDTPKVEKNWYTFVTHLKFYQGKTWADLKLHLDTKAAALKAADDVRILAGFYTHGQQDVVVVWQAKEFSLGRKFWNPILDFGTTETLVAGPSDVW